MTGNRIICLSMLLFALAACSTDNNIVYENIYLNNQLIGFNKNYIDKDSYNDFLNSWYSFIIEDDTIETGCLKSGFKVQKWVYNTGEGTYSIDWDYIQNERAKIEINLPDGFKSRYGKKPGILFEAKKSDREYLFISYPDFNNDVLGYWKYVKDQMFSSEVINEYLFYEILKDKTYFYSEYQVQRDGRVYRIFNLQGDVEGDLVEVTYTVEDHDTVFNRLKFIEIAESISINDKFMLNPSEVTKSLMRYGKNGKPIHVSI